MKRWIVYLATMGILSGCGNLLPSVSKAKEQAQKRWEGARAQVTCGVAAEHLKVGQLAEARAKVLEALALDPSYAEAKILLAKVLIEQGEYHNAATELLDVQKKLPQSDEVQYLLGVAREREGKLSEALLAYRKAKELTPENLMASKAASEVLVAMDRMPEAQAELQSALAAGADDPGLYELAGRLASMQNQHAEAAGHYERAYSLSPETVAYRESIAREQFLAGYYQKAAATLKALSAMEEYERVTWLPTMLGDCYLAMNQPLDAKDAYEEASRRDPENAGTWTKLANVSLALREYPQAIVIANHALKLQPESVDAALLLGYALLHGRQVNDAAAFLQKAAGQHPNCGTLQCLLGQALAASGDAQGAARCYASALQTEPGNVLAERLLSASAGSGTLNQK